VLAVFIEAKDDGGGGDNWSYKSCKAPVKSSPPTNQHPVFIAGRMPFILPNQQCQSTEGTKYHIPWTCLPQAHLGVFQLCHWPLIAPGYPGGEAISGQRPSWKTLQQICCKTVQNQRTDS